MRKTTLLTLALSFLIILPVTAELGKVWYDFQLYSQELQNYIQSNISNLKPLETEAQNAIGEAARDSNLPYPLTNSDAVSVLNPFIGKKGC